MTEAKRTVPLRTPLVETIDAASDLLQVSRSSIYRLIAAGDLTARHIGGRRMVTVESIERLVAGVPA